VTVHEDRDWAQVLGFDRLPEHIIGKRVTELMDLSGKRAFVTGAGGDGLGQAIDVAGGQWMN
jgi:3-oxoacyl-[acyl-carrier protein] reductase